MGLSCKFSLKPIHWSVVLKTQGCTNYGFTSLNLPLSQATNSSSTGAPITPEEKTLFDPINTIWHSVTGSSIIWISPENFVHHQGLQISPSWPGKTRLTPSKSFRILLGLWGIIIWNGRWLHDVVVDFHTYAYASLLQDISLQNHSESPALSAHV